MYFFIKINLTWGINITTSVRIVIKCPWNIKIDGVLTETSISNGIVTLTIKEQLQSNLEGLTIQVNHRPPFSSRLEPDKPNDIHFEGWGPDYLDPLTFLDTYTPEGVFANNTNYDNKIFYLRIIYFKFIHISH